ncbi:MAG: hypothetical protein R3330_11525, partial [Saprospiraceae bacterium]|nr:hypothetical protein [Saprospiraceae bacterium]
GLDNLIEVGSDVSLRWMDGLQSLAGLQNLTTVGGSFIVTDAPMLTSVESTNSLVMVGGSFTINNCPSLISMTGFNALEAVGAWFGISGDQITHVDGFASLTQVDSSIFIGGDALISLTALRHVRTAGGISIDGPFTSLDLTALQTITTYDLDIEAFNLTEFTGCDELVSVGGDVILTTGMANLPDFPKLKSIGRMLLIHSRASLEVLDGFNELESIGSGQLGWGLDVYEHDKLTTIDGFHKLSTIEGDFVISNCDLLTTVRAFESLTAVGGSFSVTQNASLTDCTPFCPFLREGTAESKAVRWNGGDNTSPCWDQDDVDLACTFDLKLIDLNPLDFPDGISKETDVRQLDLEVVASFDTLRSALCADGVTEVLVRIEVPEDGRFELMEMSERIETPWGTDVYEAEADRFYVYLLYTAPETFDPGDGGTGTYMDTVRSYKEPLAIDFINNDEERFSYTASVTVVRPPVVLVHGTFDNPADAWKTKVADLPESETMLRRLQLEGYFASAVDYESTNGDSDGSSFEDNKMVVYENEGGIRDAI